MDRGTTFDGATDFGDFSSRSGAVYTLSLDTHLTSCTVDSGVTLDTNGYHLNVRGTLANEGTICRRANNGTSNAGGGGGPRSHRDRSAGRQRPARVHPGTVNGNNGSTNHARR